ncbi:unnamed protein product [Symbiodinium natans]|uniref:Uncharacterized protein n=1 Tax=Symbiodinium natans TaxID=878477 RepID=A0A812P5P1_9DINO|nr:unnamed protein product [Symbiodinium natans]
MLRESCELNSAEVAVVHCGERVLLIQEADDVPIARKVSRDVQHSFKDRGRASFREEFEQKWRRLRVDPGPPEGRIHTLRQSAGRVPISEWRPSGTPGALSPQRTPPVPRLSPPSSMAQKDGTPAASSSAGGTALAQPMEDLLDLSEELKEPPSSQRSRVPDLAEVLSAAAGSSPPTHREFTAGADREAAKSGIPEAPPSREKRGSTFWDTESEALLSHMPRFEQLLDQQPDEIQAELIFAPYEMEEEEEAHVTSDEVLLTLAESLPKLEELDPLAQAEDAKAKHDSHASEMPKAGSGTLGTSPRTDMDDASPETVMADLLSFGPVESPVDADTGPRSPMRSPPMPLPNLEASDTFLAVFDPTHIGTGFLQEDSLELNVAPKPVPGSPDIGQATDPRTPESAGSQQKPHPAG